MRTTQTAPTAPEWNLFVLYVVFALFPLLLAPFFCGLTLIFSLLLQASAPHSGSRALAPTNQGQVVITPLLMSVTENYQKIQFGAFAGEKNLSRASFMFLKKKENKITLLTFFVNNS